MRRILIPLQKLPQFSHTLFSIYLGVAVWVALWLREEKLRGVFPLVKREAA